MASIPKLHTFSRGIGAARRLFIGSTKLEVLDGGGRWCRADAGQRAQAAALHMLAVESCGGHTAWSVQELEELLASGGPVPPELAALQAVKCAPQRLLSS